MDLQKETNEIKKHTPRPRREFDQFTATTKTTVDRAVLLTKNGDLRQKKVVFLGDDDLTSIASSMSEPSAQIEVLEIDRRIVALIKDTAREKRLNIKVREFDLRKDIPKELVGRFEVVFTDPPYTPGGVGLFLNQAIRLLKKSSESKIYLCYGTSERAKERELAIQQVINERGLVVKNKFHAFNKYVGAKSIGSQSSLYELELTPRTRELVVEKRRLYTHE